MYELEYTNLWSPGYLYGEGSLPSAVFLHRVEAVSEDVLRHELFACPDGKPSFTALVRAFESSGLIFDPFERHILHARLGIYYRHCARFLGVSVETFLKLLTSEQFMLELWLFPGNFDAGVVYVTLPNNRGTELDVFRDVIARVYMLRNPCMRRVHYVLTAPLRNARAMSRHQEEDAADRFLEIESLLGALGEAHADVRDIVLTFYKRLYPDLAIAIRILLEPCRNAQ